MVKRGKGQRRIRASFNSAINVTPFVDVSLVLLLIFMISAPLLVNDVPIELPKINGQAVPDRTETATVSIAKDGTIYLDNELYHNIDEIIEQFKRNNFSKEVQIFIRGAYDAPYEVILKCLAQLQKYDYRKISLMTEVRS